MQFWSFLGFLVQIVVAGLTATFPDQIWIGLIILITAAALTTGLFGYAAFWREPKQQTDPAKRVTDIGFGISLVLPLALLLGVWLAIPHYAERPELRLTFPGGNSNPSDTRLDNIEYWYAYHWPTTDVSPEAGQLQIMMGQQWFIVIRFKQPVKYNRLQRLFSNQNHPADEILSNDLKYALIAIHGDMAAGDLDIYTETK